MYSHRIHVELFACSRWTSCGCLPKRAKRNGCDSSMATILALECICGNCSLTQWNHCLR